MAGLGFLKDTILARTKFGKDVAVQRLCFQYAGVSLSGVAPQVLQPETLQCNVSTVPCHICSSWPISVARKKTSFSIRAISVIGAYPRFRQQCPGLEGRATFRPTTIFGSSGCENRLEITSGHKTAKNARKCAEESVKSPHGSHSFSKAGFYVPEDTILLGCRFVRSIRGAAGGAEPGRPVGGAGAECCG